MLTGSALAVLADTASGKPFEGVVVKDVVALEQFPAEVQSGSIQVKGESEEDMATRIKLSADQAVIIAARALPGKVIEVKLDDENGYLIWEAEVIGDKGQVARLKIDAGNGRLLAAESGEKGQHEGAEDRERHAGDRADRDEGKRSTSSSQEDKD